MSIRFLAGQAVSLIALALCIAAFSNKKDDRLLSILVFANIAFAAQFALFGSWVSAAVTSVIVLRIILVQRYKGNWSIMTLLLAASFGAAALTWQNALDLLPLSATVLGTFGMFMLHGIPMRICLAAAAMLWALNNLLIGSIGGTIAEIMILITNVFTIARLARDRRVAG